MLLALTANPVSRVLKADLMDRADIRAEEAVLRLLRGEELVAVAAALGTRADDLLAWKTFLEGGSQALNGRDASTGLATTSYVSMHESIVEGPRPESFVWWDSMSNDDVAAFEAALDTARREEDVQAYLTAHPLTLVQPLGGGPGRWVIPKKRLGSEHVRDFMIGDKDSTGHRWIAVELESPHAAMFTKSGNDSANLRLATCDATDRRLARLARPQSVVRQEPPG